MQITSKYKIARRLGSPIFEKTQTHKFAMSEAKRKTSGKRPRPLTEFGKQLLEKQKIRFTYIVNERQLQKYANQVLTKKGVKQSDLFFRILESRLDSTVYRAGFAPTRLASRQMVNHGHILLNGKRVNIPSASVKIGDNIGISLRSQKKPLFAGLDEKMKNWVEPSWINFDITKKIATVTSLPSLEKGDAPADFDVVLEFYKR